MSDGVGSVVALWRYPVKSMMGEEVADVEVTERGVVGDRTWALVDRETGKVASAKNPRLWGRLFECAAVFTTAPADGQPGKVKVTLPDGTTATSDEDGVDATLSRMLGRAVGLSAAPPEMPVFEDYWPDVDGLPFRDEVTDLPLAMSAPGTFFDYAPVHLLTTGALDALHQARPESRFDVRRFRPNLVIAPPDGATGFVENAWVSRTLAIGERVRLEIVAPCPRCVMTTLPQGDLPKDTDVLRTASRENRMEFMGHRMPTVGVYAAVRAGGRVRRGDAVRVL